MTERWRSIVGFEHYEVRDLGRVRSLDRDGVRKDGRRYFMRGRILKQQLVGRCMYRTVLLHSVPDESRKTVHRLVAVAFLVEDLTRPFVNHKDGIKVHNGVMNLEWCTKSENAIHSFRVLGQRTSLPRKPVNVGGVNYPSMFSAACALGISAGHIHSALAKSHRVQGMEVRLG